MSKLPSDRNPNNETILSSKQVPFSPSQEQVIALAGLYQAVILTHQLASNGQLDAQAANACWQALLVTNPKSTADVYGGKDCLINLSIGLRGLEELLRDKSKWVSKNTTSKSPTPIQATRYMVGVIYLQKKLSKQPRLITQLGSALVQADKKAEMFGIDHQNVIAHFADIYSQYISPLGKPIHVTGDISYLQQAAHVNRIRSLLLSGIRSATLWRQLGGRRWQFITGKKKLTMAIDELRASSSF